MSKRRRLRKDYPKQWKTFVQFRHMAEKHQKVIKRNWDYMKSKHMVSKHSNEGHRTWSVGASE